MNKAIIDIGTNTFNLLVANFGPGGHWCIEFANSIPVFLGKNAGERNEIQPDRMLRALDAIHIHLNNALNYDCREFVLTGTAMMRNATNASKLVEAVRKRFSKEIKVINGQAEAAFIFKGIGLLLPQDNKVKLLMDIGGGSVEFVIFRNEEVLWKSSYPLGVSHLSNLLPLSDPLTKEDLLALKRVIDSETYDLWENIKIHKPTVLVGSAGSFDTLSAIATAFQQSFDLGTSQFISLDDFRKMQKMMLSKKADERIFIQGMEPSRVHTLPLACVLIDHVLGKSNISIIHRTAYAMREGIAASMADGTFDAIVNNND